MKHAYEILNHIWNLSPLSESMQLLLARKKCRRQQSKVKVMVIMAYDKNLVIATECLRGPL